jgi:hypothetical protein
MTRVPHRLFRLDRDAALLPLARNLAELQRKRVDVGNDRGFNSPEYGLASEAIRSWLYDQQDSILDALYELCEATAPEGRSELPPPARPREVISNEYAIETLRQEYYRIASDIRRVPAEMWAYGFNAVAERRRQAALVEALQVLGAAITAEMFTLLAEVRAAQGQEVSG